MAKKEDAEEKEMIDMDETCSPQFALEANRLVTQIKNLVEHNHSRRFFSDLSSNMGDFTSILRVSFNNMMSKMEEKEKHFIVKELIRLVHHCAEKYSPDKIFLAVMYERVVDELLLYAYKKETIALPQCIEGLIMTSDFRMCSRIDQKKWKFIGESIPKFDYRGIRSIIRYLLESQLRRLPWTLAPEKVHELRVVEDVVLKIIDRDSNLMPPLITLSEVIRGMPKQAHMFPRLTDKLAGLSSHFRPIADLSHVCGRPFIYPIPLHPSYHPPTSFWEEFGMNINNTFTQSHHMLPYRPQHKASCQYTLYMILRQPLGKDSLHPTNRAKTKSHWELLLSVMICEAMAETERLPENKQIPRYQWDNIVNLVIYGMTHKLLNPKTFFQVLRSLMKQCKYTRARDEVMWIVFQVVSSLSHVVQIDQSIQEIVDLYNELFNGDFSWTGASDHPALMARFLAAASTWMLLEKDHPKKIPAPNDTIKSHIKVIQDAAENFDPKNMGMLAVLANAYKTDTKIGKLLLPAMIEALDAQDQTQPIFTLSYLRKAVNQFEAFPVEFLDALTFRAKKNLLMHSSQLFRQFSTDKLPSPAVFETIARICQSEDYEGAIKDLESLAQRSLHVTTMDRGSAENQIMQAKDQCHFLFDFLAYRLPYLHSYGKYSSTISTLLHYFAANVVNNPQNHQIYRLLEQVMMRRMCWRSFHECVQGHTSLFGSGYKEIGLMRMLMHPKTFSEPVDQFQFLFNPEIFKMAMYAFLRALAITGQEIQLENTMHVIHMAGFGWPQKSTSFFPKWAHDAIKASDPKKLLPNYQEILENTKEACQMYHQLSPYQYLLRYAEDQDKRTFHCMLAAIFRYLFALVVDEKGDIEVTTTFYEVLEKKSPKDNVVMGNYLIDYLIADVKTRDRDEKLFKNIAKTAALMCFQFNILRSDRFLLSLTMHPTTDEDALICIQIANEFILTTEFTDLIKWFYTNVPKKEHHPFEYIKAIVKYHDHYPEFEACQLVRTFDAAIQNVHMPTYYGCLVERLLPILDQYVYVALEQQGYKLSPQILQNVSMFYKYHPMPLHFLYSVLFVSHGKMEGPDAKAFVTAFAAQIEECHLTEAFEKYNHQKASCEELIMELIDRMSSSLDFVLAPPSFVAKDWKTAELSPGAQALYLACIELMASPHSPETLVTAMINLMQVRPHLRPFNVFNLIALILTALPPAYSAALHEEFIGVFKSGETAKLKFEEIVFDNYDQDLLLHLPNRARSINMIVQIYWTHCNLALLDHFAKEQVPEILKHVKTEKDLWYTLRLVMPIVRRFYDCWDTAKQMRCLKDRFGPLHMVKLIIEKLGALAESGAEIVHQQPFCDLFYNCKYIFAGDFLRDTAIVEFAKLPEPMRERLKYYVGQGEPVPSESPEREKTPERRVERPKEAETRVQAPPPPQQHPPQQHHPVPAPSVPQQHHQQPHPSQLMPPPQQPLQHHQHHPQQHPQHLQHQQMPQHPQHHQQHHQMPQHPQMELHPQIHPQHMAPQTPAPAHHMGMHQQMTPQYPGPMFHHQQAHLPMQYGGMHHMHHQQQMQNQMHMNFQGMTPQQYAYMMQHQQYLQHQQQQHGHHGQPPHM